MNSRVAEVAVVGSAIGYLALLASAMANLSFDIWGALILIPVYGVLGAVLVRGVFRSAPTHVATAMYCGLVIRLGGIAARYWIGFEAYDGFIDAGRYHEYAVQKAGAVWSGDASFVSVIPRQIGTPFVDQFTALVYTVTGGSQLAGFVTFSFLAYVGIICFVKAAVVAIPSLATRRYAWLCVLLPSVVYWPSSIGKEALMLFGLGIASYGIAVMLTHGRWGSSLLIVSAGLGFSALIRPHIAAIWVAAALPALVVAVMRQNKGAEGRRSNRAGLVFVLVVAAVSFSVLATVTVQFLAPPSYEEVSTTNSFTQIIDNTTARTGQGGSNFTPPSVSNPASWPYASVRTLFRPLPFEASGAAQLLSAAEITALLGLYALSWKRLRNLPRLVISNPYVTFVVAALFLTGLAYTSLANLGILTRQKSLIMALLALLACLPERQQSESSQSASSTNEGLADTPATSPDRSDVLVDSYSDPTDFEQSIVGTRRANATAVDEFWSS